MFPFPLRFIEFILPKGKKKLFLLLNCTHINYSVIHSEEDAPELMIIIRNNLRTKRLNTVPLSDWPVRAISASL
jgi:hypothetical protein